VILENLNKAGCKQTITQIRKAGMNNPKMKFIGVKVSMQDETRH
jgi:hypothetical protein